MVRCKLKKCLSYGKSGRIGICDDPVPSIIELLKPNKKACPFYSTDHDADIKWVKKIGGIMNLIKTNKKDRKKQVEESEGDL